jgi:hypothetical protein
MFIFVYDSLCMGGAGVRVKHDAPENARVPFLISLMFEEPDLDPVNKTVFSTD